MENVETNRRRFIHNIAKVGAAGGIATLLAGQLSEKPLISEVGSSPTALEIDIANSGSGNTTLESTVTSGAAFGVYATATSGIQGGSLLVGVQGNVDAAGGTWNNGPWPIGVHGNASATSGTTMGVFGECVSPDGIGVQGWTGANGGTWQDGPIPCGAMGHASAASGAVWGVCGQADSCEGQGVAGIATAPSSSTGMEPTGVYGEAWAAGGGWQEGPWPVGVRGYAKGSTGATTGVFGVTDSPDGVGVSGYANATSVGAGSFPVGVVGGVDSDGGPWAEGPWPTGVYGYSGGGSGATIGVEGDTWSPEGEGVAGIAFAVSGWANGVYGHSEADNGAAVWGNAVAESSSPGLGPVGVGGRAYANGGSWEDGPWPTGVFGYASGASGATTGVAGRSDSPNGIGVNGWTPNSSSWTSAVEGDSGSENGGCGVVGWAYATSGSSAGVWGGHKTPNGVGVQGDSDGEWGIGVLGHARNSATAVPIVAWAASGQSASLQEWVSSDWTTLAAVDKDGKLGIGTGTPNYMLHIMSGVVGPLTAASAPGAGPAPNSFICENLTPGNFKSQFTFKASGANKWSFGNDMGGSGGQNFFIWDEVSAACRFYVDSSGRVGIGTTMPYSTSKLHVAGRVRATGYDTGDITFANGVQATEEGDGLAFVNSKGTKIAVLDSEGNWHIKGKVLEDL